MKQKQSQEVIKKTVSVQRSREQPVWFAARTKAYKSSTKINKQINK